MAFTPGTFKVYTGLASMHISAINPDANSVYLSKTDVGIDKVRIDIMLGHKDPNIKTKIAFFLENREYVSTTGNKKIINNFGQNCYAPSIDAIPDNVIYFKKEDMRYALVGEAELIDFFRTWLSVPLSMASTFDNLRGVFKGDFSELQNYIEANRNRKIQVLLTVNVKEPNVYQSVFTKHFERGNSVDRTRWDKTILKLQENNQVIPNYGNSYELKEFNYSPEASPAPVSVAPGSQDLPF